MSVSLQRHANLTTSWESKSKGLESLASSRPFTRQIDVIFPASRVTEDELTALESENGGTYYREGSFTLSSFVEHARLCIEHGLTVLARSVLEKDEVWCIDANAVLTLSICKPTYEQLGVVGTPIRRQQRYIIRVSLRGPPTGQNTRSRVERALKKWDELRERAGVGPWRVSFHLVAPAGSRDVSSLLQDPSLKVPVEKQLDRVTNIHVPVIPDCMRPPPEPDAREDWTEGALALFEWVGMACLGAQRLKANDRVDPYVAVYEPPSPSRIGECTHIRWTGSLLPPDFVQTAIRRICWLVSSGSLNDSFISITLQGSTNLPLPSNILAASSSETNAPPPNPRDPRDSGEDTLCLILSLLPPTNDGTSEEPSSSSDSGCAWIMMESCR